MRRMPKLRALIAIAVALVLQAQAAPCQVDEPSATTVSSPTAATNVTPASESPGSIETDREALVALYNATDGPNWTNNDNWLSEAPIGGWWGVTTDYRGRVIQLVLPRNGLIGRIPPEVGNLSRLEALQITKSQLSGEIPRELSRLVRLSGLYLSQNQLSGEIPKELGQLTNLQWLELDGNHLSGEVPPELGNLDNLTYLLLFGYEQRIGAYRLPCETVYLFPTGRIAYPLLSFHRTPTEMTGRRWLHSTMLRMAPTGL